MRTTQNTLIIFLHVYSRCITTTAVWTKVIVLLEINGGRCTIACNLLIYSHFACGRKSDFF